MLVNRRWSLPQSCEFHRARGLPALVKYALLLHILLQHFRSGVVDCTQVSESNSAMVQREMNGLVELSWACPLQQQQQQREEASVAVKHATSAHQQDRVQFPLPYFWICGEVHTDTSWLTQEHRHLLALTAAGDISLVPDCAVERSVSDYKSRLHLITDI